MLWGKKHIFINLSWQGGYGPILSSFEVLEVPKRHRSSTFWPGLLKTLAPLAPFTLGHYKSLYWFQSFVSVSVVFWVVLGGPQNKKVVRTFYNGVWSPPPVFNNYKKKQTFYFWMVSLRDHIRYQNVWGVLWHINLFPGWFFHSIWHHVILAVFWPFGLFFGHFGPTWTRNYTWIGYKNVQHIFSHCLRYVMAH